MPVVSQRTQHTASATPPAVYTGRGQIRGREAEDAPSHLLSPPSQVCAENQYGPTSMWKLRHSFYVLCKLTYNRTVSSLQITTEEPVHLIYKSHQHSPANYRWQIIVQGEQCRCESRQAKQGTGIYERVAVQGTVISGV